MTDLEMFGLPLLNDQELCMKIASYLFFGILMVNLFNDCHSDEHISLIVNRSPDPTGIFPSSQLYTATIQNDTRMDIVLAAVQMPGGYVGSGTFFNCYLEQWDKREGAWSFVPSPGFGGLIKTNRTSVRIKPGKNIEVCRSLLPHDAGSPGSKMRFRLESSWEEDGDVYISAPFIIDEVKIADGP
jgi:hypothetical protein